MLSCKTSLESVTPVAEAGPDHRLGLGGWLSAMRLDSICLTEVVKPSVADHDRLAKMMESIGVSGIDPAHILVAAKAGSHLYNLTLPTSDTDYIVIYRHPTEDLISSVTHLKVRTIIILTCT